MIRITRTVALHAFAVLVAVSSSARAQTQVLAWGDNTHGQCNVSPVSPGISRVAVAAGQHHMLALCSDGSIVAWGENGLGQCNVPPLPPGVTYVEVAAGAYHSVARQSDGSIVAWGSNSYGQCNVPPFPPGLVCVDVAAGSAHTLALLSDGSLLAWGQNAVGQCDVPPLSPGFSYAQAAAGGEDSVAILSDGSCIEWGDNSQGQHNVEPLPPGLAYIEVSVGWFHTLARRSDGSVVAWGFHNFGQCSVPPLPAGLVYREVAGGGNHSLARRSDGAVLGWGINDYGLSTIPPIPPGFEATGLAASWGNSAILLASTFTTEALCFGDGSSAACPCGNTGSVGHGCNNSIGTGGALLSSSGQASLSLDTLHLSSSGELASALSVVLQGDAFVAPANFGDGLRCAGGHLKRLYAVNASGGAVSVPAAGGPPISVRSAALGDPIGAGTLRVYQTYYRDPNLAFCPGGFNVSNAIAVTWGG